ncbi:unnamed protein product [Calypogeia fissa]
MAGLRNLALCTILLLLTCTQHMNVMATVIGTVEFTNVLGPPSHGLPSVWFFNTVTFDNQTTVVDQSATQVLAATPWQTAVEFGTSTIETTFHLTNITGHYSTPQLVSWGPVCSEDCSWTADEHGLSLENFAAGQLNFIAAWTGPNPQ